MSYRLLLTIVSVGLLVAAVTTVETRQIDWRPIWPVRFGLVGAGLLLALGALLVGRRAGESQDGPRPKA